MTTEVEMNTNGRPDGKPMRFFVYCKVDDPDLIEKQLDLCRIFVAERGGSIVDEALDAGPDVVVDTPEYARLYDALNEGTVDAFVTDMTAFGPTMILGLYAVCAVSGVEMWSLTKGRVTAEQIRALGESLQHGLNAGETMRDMLGPKGSSN